jgi:hypothetical protein
MSELTIGFIRCDIMYHALKSISTRKNRAVILVTSDGVTFSEMVDNPIQTHIPKQQIRGFVADNVCMSLKMVVNCNQLYSDTEDLDDVAVCSRPARLYITHFDNPWVCISSPGSGTFISDAKQLEGSK